MTKNRVCGTICALSLTIVFILTLFYDKINTEINLLSSEGITLFLIIFGLLLSALITILIWFKVEINVGQFPLDY